MGSESRAGMTSAALRAFLVWRDLGPTRNRADACELLGYSRNSVHLISRWASKYNWEQLIVEHDHAQLREALGQREIIREKAQQIIIERMEEAAEVIAVIMSDGRSLPILNRQGKQMKDDDGNLLWKDAVKESTRLEAAKALLGIGGLVPVKRMEYVDKTGEDLDRAAKVIASFTPGQLEKFSAMLEEDE